MNCPKKYRMNYADKTIQNGLDALKYAQLANGIYIGSGASDEAFKQREEYLRLSIGLIEHIATACFIFLEQAKKYGGVYGGNVWIQYLLNSKKKLKILSINPVGNYKIKTLKQTTKL